MAERIGDSRFQLPDGRRFVAAAADPDTRAFFEVLPLEHLARYPGELLLDTFFETVDEDLVRVQPEHLEPFEESPGRRAGAHHDPFPAGSWWLYEELAHGTWLTEVLPKLWQAAGRLHRAGPYGDAELLAVVTEVAAGIEFAGPPPGGPVETAYCARHGEPHSRREVDLAAPCPLCGRAVTRDQVVRWLVPARREAPGLTDLRLQWHRSTTPEWLR